MPMFVRMEGTGQHFFGKSDGQRGSIDFDFPETKVILNEKGEPIEIRAV